MLTRDDETLAAAIEWREQGRGVAIATVVETWGSLAACRLAPRHRRDWRLPALGLRRLRRRRRRRGSARRHLVGERPTRSEFGVADETAWRVGLSCGGRIKSFVERVETMKLEYLKELTAARRERRAAVLITRLSDGAQRFVAREGIAADPLADALEAALSAGPQLRELSGRARPIFSPSRPRRRQSSS